MTTNQHTPAQMMVQAKALVHANLPAACAEVAAWRSTGLLPDGIVRQAAEILSALEVHGSTRMAEDMVLDAAIRALAVAAHAGEAEVPELAGVQQTVAEGGGFWRSCSGCHELNEGHDTGPHSKVFGCALGNGCAECGGLGAIWDTTDYNAMGDYMAAAGEQAAQQSAAAPVGVPSDADIEALADKMLGCTVDCYDNGRITGAVKFARAILARENVK